MPIPAKFTNAQLVRIAQGLASLDGLRTSPDSFRPYKFDDENETVWLIAENTDLVQTALKTFNSAKKLLSTQHQIAEGMKIDDKNAERVQAFMVALDLLENKEVEIALKPISRARLKVGQGEKKNPIPPSVLAALMPILED